jgi:hypothetical protein
MVVWMMAREMLAYAPNLDAMPSSMTFAKEQRDRA